MQHLGTATFRTLLFDLHLLRSDLALSLTIVILAQPFLALSNKDFCGDRFAGEFLEGVTCATSKACDFEGVGLQIQQLTALSAEVRRCCYAVHNNETVLEL